MANAELLKKLKAASTIELSSVLEDSTVFNKGDLIQTPVPMLNVALSGALDGGFASGLTLWAGPSKHFKSSFVLMCAASYMRKYPDAILLFYDSEFGTPQGYFKAMGVPTDRVFHVPVTTVEQLRSDIAKQLENIKKGDHVFIAIDSVGNLASAKEVKDAIEEHSAADMTRAKQIKSLFRIITPQLSLKDIPCHCVMHIYMTMEMFSKPVVSGGCLLAGTKIVTVDGLKNVEDMQVGEKVVSANGRISSVTRTWNPETLLDGNPECFEIEFEDGSIIRCSDNQQFIKDGKWISVCELKEHDDIETI